MLNELKPEVLNPPAVVVQAFDEQQAKREWDEASADIEDATERKVAILQAALKRWPMVPGTAGQMKHHPEMRRFVRDVLGMADQLNGSMNAYAGRLVLHGAAGARKNRNEQYRRVARYRHAVAEITTHYRNGADPKQCMDALVKFYEEQTRG